MKHIHCLLAAAALVAALSGCGPTAPESTPKPTTSAAEPTPTGSPLATVAPLAIPDCETMLPLAQAQALFSASTAFLGEQPTSEFVGRLTVPSTPVVLSTASPARGCFWGIPQSDGLFELVVAEITEAQRTTLQGELAAAGYAETTMGTVTAFELAGEDEVSSLGTTHLFTGDVWIVCDGTLLGLSGAVTGAALDALRAANPTLGL